MQFQVAQKKNSQKLRYGELGGQATRQPSLPKICSMEWLLTTMEKCAGAPSCRNHTLWCAVTDTPYSNSGRSGKFSNTYVSSTLPCCSSSPIYLYSSYPAHRPLEGYYYRDFHRLNVVCSPTFSGHLSSPCYILSPF
ncbi:hypothetical protein TNCV_220631 [Trichonephila clavipes]|nr:hypothetical protein TNCV_220631 [Trichonephila clavipes]